MSAKDELQVPTLVKSVIFAIERIGFPVVAFLLMTYVAFVGLQRQDEGIHKLTTSIEKSSAVLADFMLQVRGEHRTMMDALRIELQDKGK